MPQAHSLALCLGRFTDVRRMVLSGGYVCAVVQVTIEYLQQADGSDVPRQELDEVVLGARGSLTPGVSRHGGTSKQFGRADFLGPCPQGHGHN